MTNVKVHKKSNCLIYVQNKQIKKTNMAKLSKYSYFIHLADQLIFYYLHIYAVSVGRSKTKKYNFASKHV
jgi:hypothetical protein